MNLTIVQRLLHYVTVLKWYGALLKNMKHPTEQLFGLVVRDLKDTARFTARNTKRGAKVVGKHSLNVWSISWFPLYLLGMLFCFIALAAARGPKLAKQKLREGF